PAFGAPALLSLNNAPTQGNDSLDGARMRNHAEHVVTTRHHALIPIHGARIDAVLVARFGNLIGDERGTFPYLPTESLQCKSPPAKGVRLMKPVPTTPREDFLRY